MRKRIKHALVAALIVIPGLVAWHDTTTATLRHAEVPVSGLGRDVTILHVSDLHGATFGTGQADIARLLEDRSFDAVVMNGDHIPRFESDPAPALELLAVLQEHAPVVFVTRGNHDTTAVIQLLVDRGAVFLAPGDDAVRFARDAGLVVAIPALQPGHTPSDAAAVLAVGHFPMSDAAIAAQPLPATATGVYLFGHTHGGQVRLPLVGAIWAPGPVDAIGAAGPRHEEGNFFPELRGRTLSGLSRVGDVYTHTSAGLGTQSVRLRFLCPAEMTAITLKAVSRRSTSVPRVGETRNRVIP
jgi:hypothetical protein